MRDFQALSRSTHTHECKTGYKRSITEQRSVVSTILEQTMSSDDLQKICYSDAGVSNCLHKMSAVVLPLQKRPVGRPVGKSMPLGGKFALANAKGT